MANPDPRPYDGNQGVINLVFHLQNGASRSTGVYKLGIYARNIIGPFPPVLQAKVIGYQNNLFGNYPVHKDRAPSIVFSVCFAIIFIAHLTLFIVNCTRGHKFYISMAWSFIALMKVIGFATRAVWCEDILWVPGGMAGEVFLMISSILLITVNLILAQRIFTWRHPVGGNRRLFRYFMYMVYSLVIVIIVGSIMSSVIPYLYFLSDHAHLGYKIAISVSAGFIILYSVMAISLVGLAYFFKPTRKDENLYTYQPWWIESFHPLYFVKKNAAREAEETFMKRNHNHRHAVRVIASTHHHYNLVEGLTNQRGALKHNKSILIVTLTTLLSFVESILRGIACFSYQDSWRNSVVCEPIVAYMCWGVLEVLINILYLAGRVDLRFYQPDVLPKKVRNIITAEQSIEPSAVASDNEFTDEEITDDYMDDEYFTDEEDHSQPSNHKQRYSDPSSNATKHSPPQYTQEHKHGYHEKHSEDDAYSEFHF